MTCAWCGAPMPETPNRGSPRRFCSTICRHAYRRAAVAWADDLIRTGRLGVETLRLYAQQKARALVSDGSAAQEDRR